MIAQRLNRLHVDNLCHLIQLRDAIHQDIAEACITYNMSRLSAERYGNATDDELHELAFAVDAALFTPRFTGEEVNSLLQSPPALRGTLVAVQSNGTRHRVETTPGSSVPSRLVGRG